MQEFERISLSRRRLLGMASVSAAAAVFARRPLFAKDEGIVPTMVNAAARAKITIQPIRRNISVLEGSGGNIAVLTGRDGKLLVEAGFSVSRPAISNALTSINSDPIQHLINLTGTRIIRTETPGCTPPAPKSPRTKTHGSASR